MKRLTLIAAALTGLALTAPAAQAGMGVFEHNHKITGQSAAPQMLKIKMIAKPGGKLRAVEEPVKPVREIEPLRPLPRPDPVPFGGRGATGETNSLERH